MQKPIITPIINVTYQMPQLSAFDNFSTSNLLTILAHLIYLMYILNQAPNPLETD